MSDKQNNPLIYSAISNVMKDLEAVPKSKQSSGGGANYKYRSIDQIYAAAQKIMAKHGVFTVPKRLSRIDSKVTTKSGSEMSHAVIVFEYRFYASDGSFIEVVLDGEGLDNSDKVSGKCASYAHKYALMQVFCIPTDEADDPDKETHEPISSSHTKPVQKLREPEAKMAAPIPNQAPPALKRENRTIAALDKMMQTMKTHNISADEARVIMKEITGKEHSGELTTPEIEYLTQALLDSKGAIR